jgi:hypothetical protein
MQPPNKNIRQYSGVRMLSSSLNFVTKPIFKQRGFVENKIITDWDFIVGKELGSCSTPKKISFAKDKKANGILHVEVYDSGLAMEMTYMEPVLIEKISVYFGYKAVEKLKILQRPGGKLDIKEAKKVAVRNLSEEKKTLLNSYLSEIEDEDLRLALSSLGRDVMSDI